MELELPQVLDPNVDHDQTPPPARVDYRSNVDTSRPFRSVKEAVAIFGERFLAGEIYTPKPFSFPRKETPFFAPSPVVEPEPQHWSHSSPSPRGSSCSNATTLSDTVRKLEAELENTKAELKLLKERESETEVALASLNAELHKNMSKLALAEAAVAARAASRGGDGADGAMIIREEEKKRDAYLKMESGASQSLAQILSIGDEKEGLFVGRKKERKLVMKKKPIVPLVGDLFSRKKRTSTTLHNPLYAPSHLQWN
ncbi:UNVERIFIED_CONTAM: WEB family protein [Sesamum indicum]